MIINYYGEYDIDTNNIQDKLEIIQKSKTENASYLSHILMKALLFWFEKESLNAPYLHENIPDLEENYEAIVLFSNSENSSIKANIPVIRIGNGKTNLKDEKCPYLNIKHVKKVRKLLQKYQKIAIGFCPEDIEFLKYYDIKTRVYFLNVLDMLNKMPISKFEEDAEKACTGLVLNRMHFVSPLPKEKGKISLKKMMAMYEAIIETVPNFKLCDGKLLFYMPTKMDGKNIKMLNELSLLAELYANNNKEERISKIYDIMCERFLKEAHALGYCMFENNRCIASRFTDGFPNSKENGCCQNTYKDKGKNCRYLNSDYSCKICSISCRAFACAYLQERGIDHALFYYPLIDVTFGKLKKSEIVYDFFTPKEEMMKKLT